MKEFAERILNDKKMGLIPLFLRTKTPSIKALVNRISRWLPYQETASIEEGNGYCVIQCDYGSFKLNFRICFDNENVIEGIEEA